jgi:nitroreductase
MLDEVDRGATGGVAAAPVLVVVAADTERGLPQTVPSSIFPAVQNLLLMATALGLGSALTTLSVGYADELQRICALPPTVVPVAVIPLAYPARPLGRPRRDDFRGHTHREAYGSIW